jgi:hypothetical protein
LPRWPKALLFPLTTKARAAMHKFARQRSASAEQHIFCVVTPATVVPVQRYSKSQRPQSLYPARATRGVAPTISGKMGNGIERFY